VELNLATIHETLAAELSSRPCVIWRGRTWTWAEITDRTRRLANVLGAHGIGRTRRLDDCAGWESPHDHVGLYLHNGNAYLGGQLAASKATAAAFNVNYRYVADELAYLFGDAAAAGIIYQGSFADTLAAVLPRLDPRPRLLLRVDDGSGDTLLPGAQDYEAAIAAAPAERPDVEWRPDDLYILYSGGTVVIQDVVDRLDPVDVLDTCERHRVTSLLIVGDAFARPLLDEQRARPRDLSSLRFVLTGGAILSPLVRRHLLDAVPQVRIVDVLGSSETGRQAVADSTATSDDGPTRFAPSAHTAVLSDDLSRRLGPGDGEIGWLAQGGRIPRGYLGDEAKSRATFATVGDERWAVAGDRAAVRADGTIELHGRESVTINTGGEKVFAEEVEAAIKHHPGVYDALPKDLVVRGEIGRSPSGKPDYAWARAQLA
jgi:fatty-acyl-CoA synthase